MRFCIILGAMKAGTTSLFHYLSQHPEIAPCQEKEPSFFSHHYEKGIEYYLGLWEKQDLETKILLESSTNYTKHPSFACSSRNILEFAQKYDVNIKFVYIMRNPLKRLVSQYTYSYARWTTESLEERIQHGHIINVSRYAHQLDQYYEKFDPENFLLLNFDDLKRSPETVLKEICEFLHIHPNFPFSGLAKIHNKSEGRAITRPVDRIYLKYPAVRSFSNLFPKGFRTTLSKLLFRKKITQSFKLSAAQRKFIHMALKKDMARLQDKYGVDVSKWEF